MKRAAEIAAQVFTARDAMLRDTAEDMRVAFLLFDSATETLMVRRVQYLSSYLLRSDSPWHVRPDQQVSPTLDDPDQRDREQALRAPKDYIHWSFSRTQVAGIDRNFDDKLRFLAWNGDIPREYVSIVSRLHEYRNEMYHREESRPEALRIIVHLYAFLVCEFLEHLSPQTFSWSTESTNQEARMFTRIGVAVPSSRGVMRGLELQAQMANALRKDLDLADAPELIAAYIADRVKGIHDSLEFIGDVAGSVYRAEYSEMDTVRFVCEPTPAGPRCKTPTRADIRRWDEWSVGARKLLDPLSAFRSLAEFEKQFEPFERAVSEVALQADLEVDRQIEDAKERRFAEADSD
ncbi:hypothetical protein GCM10025760_16890 [Microbacterium yannicii]|uniref:DUF4145 domain-containing protein n=1 Tax=Microbacterium yannicii TaxID=671622 RepID=A0ABP9M7U7_9MICO|nr:hypothetical protein [Microbacterium yannicii]MCO5955121.1 hypothetical protein [Microbacterium yannicii]